MSDPRLRVAEFDLQQLVGLLDLPNVSVVRCEVDNFMQPPALMLVLCGPDFGPVGDGQLIPIVRPAFDRFGFVDWHMRSREDLPADHPRGRSEALDRLEVLAAIEDERMRQVEAEGFDSAHDDEHLAGDLAAAGSAYAERAADFMRRALVSSGPPVSWPFHPSWFKPRSPERDLVRAAALIVAELERMKRAQRKARQEGGANDAGG